MLHAITTEKIIESVHIKDTIYLDKMEYDKQRDVKWVRVDDVINDLNYIIISLDQRNEQDIRYKEALEDYRNRLEALR